MSINKVFIVVMRYRTRGGALYYAIFVMLFLSLMSVMLLSFFEFSFREDTLFAKQTELNDHLNSAITYLSCFPEKATPGAAEYELDLFGDSSALVGVHSTRWGLLRKLHLTTGWKGIKRQRTVLMAEKDETLPALWMPDRNRYVSLVGKSYINGDCHISELGLRKGNAEGRYFEGPYLHKGKVIKSEPELPPLNPDLINYFNNYFSGTETENDSLISSTVLKRNKELMHPFSQKTLFIRDNRKLVLEKGRFEGNIIIASVDTIEVWPTVQLKNIVLLARTIIFKQGFKGRLQAFAREKLVIEKNCEFNYPSFLGVLGVNPELSIMIMENNRVNGGLICYSLVNDENPPLITIEKQSTVFGQIYVNGDVSFTGSIYGSLFCNRFVMRTPRAFYENFMLDCAIDVSKLPDEYASFSVSGNAFRLREAVLCN